MKRRNLLRKISFLSLLSAVFFPNVSSAQSRSRKGSWFPKKQLIRKSWSTSSLSSSSTNLSIVKPVLSGCIRSGNLLFVSGIGGWYPEKRKEPGDIKIQIASALEIMKDVLESGGSSMANVLKVHMTLADPNKNLPDLNEVYREYFPDPPPVRSYTGCGIDQMGRDGVLVQIDCIAYVD